ncbi:hypothetical protein [Nocardioides sp. TRM66260-LWL]|nr:hypothetical protein [Nocardioides sp. TRM66260-LWL]
MAIDIDRLLKTQAKLNTAIHVSSPPGWVAIVDADCAQEIVAAR